MESSAQSQAPLPPLPPPPGKDEPMSGGSTPAMSQTQMRIKAMLERGDGRLEKWILTLSRKELGFEQGRKGFANLPMIEDFLATEASPPPWRADSVAKDTKKRRTVFEALRRDMVVKGVITSVRSFGVLIHIQQVLHYVDGERIRDKRRHFQDIHLLDIKGLIRPGELSDEHVSDPSTLLNSFREGEVVKGVVVQVAPESERIQLSLRPKYRGSVGKSSPIRLNDFDEEEEEERPLYNKLLRQDPSAMFNLGGLQMMASAYSIDVNSCASLLPVESYPKEAYYEELRVQQNKSWAHETVAQGISYAKQGNYTEAMKCYAQALDVDPKHRDAFVARGAAYANRNMLEAAVKEFQTALSIDPDDANAQKYLKATQQKIADKKNREAAKELTKEELIAQEKAKEKEKVNEKLRELLEKEEERKRRKKRKRERREKDPDKRRRSRTKDKDKDDKKKKKKKEDRKDKKNSGSTSSSSSQKKRRAKRRRKSQGDASPYGSASSSPSSSSYSSRSPSPSPPSSPFNPLKDSRERLTTTTTTTTMTTLSATTHNNHHTTPIPPANATTPRKESATRTTPTTPLPTPSKIPPATGRATPTTPSSRPPAQVLNDKGEPVVVPEKDTLEAIFGDGAKEQKKGRHVKTILLSSDDEEKED